MALDPRTPVLVGGGQVTSRPDAGCGPDARPDPLALMADALRLAALDTGAPSSGHGVLQRVESLAVVGGLGWRLENPGLLVAQSLRISPRELVRSATGGTMPLSLVARAASMIAQGELDVAVVTGAECVHSLMAARRTTAVDSLGWPSQDPERTARPLVFGADTSPASALETACGVALPVDAYPLMENARRAANGWTIAEHRARIGERWATFSAVAAENPDAWIRRRFSANEIVEPSHDNRMVAFPYTKRCCANIAVDQGAAVIICSVEAARAASIPNDRWVFALGVAEAHDHWYLSERPALDRSPAMAAAGRRALGRAGVGPDDLGALDCYSCFPVVVEMAVTELGLDPGHDRPLTVTGGLTFFGGPGNNYVTHALATMATRLREAPGTAGLVTGLGWYATKHAVSVWASRPPAGAFVHEDVQGEVDALERCPVDERATGPVSVETYTVSYGRDGSPERATVVCRTPAGVRAWGRADDEATLVDLAGHEAIGRRGVLGEDHTFRLD